MLKISQNQFLVFKNVYIEKFIIDSIEFLNSNFAQWVKNKSKDELDNFVRDTIEFAQLYSIKKEINVQKLMYFRINFNFPIPLTIEHRNLLLETEKNEDGRMRNFYKILMSNK